MTYFGSRNWTTDDEGEPQFGEQAGPQTWFDGHFPGPKPNAILIGTQDCLDNGSGDHQPFIYNFGAIVVGHSEGQTESEFFYFIGQYGLRIVAEGPFPDSTSAAARITEKYGDFTAADYKNYVGWPFVPGNFPCHFGWYIVVAVYSPIPFDDCGRYVAGVDARCWVPPLNAWCMGLHQIEAPAATITAGVSWIGTVSQIEAPEAFLSIGLLGDIAQIEAPAADIAQGFTIEGEVSQIEAPAATSTAGTAIVGTVSQIEAPAATARAGFICFSTLAQIEAPAATSTAAYVFSGVAPEKEAPTGTIVATQFLYCQNVNTDTTCDVSGETNNDLALSVGSGSVSRGVTNTTNQELVVWDMAFTGVDGTYNVSCHFTTVGLFAGSAKFRLQILNSSCTVVYNSAYSASITSAGTYTISPSVTWPSGGVRVRIALEAFKTGGLPGNITLACDSSSYVQAPY